MGNSIFSSNVMKSCGCSCSNDLAGCDYHFESTEGCKEATIVYVAKEIVTMNPSWPTGTHVCVRGGRILSVGNSLEDMKPWLTRDDWHLDESFKDLVILPGFIEPHIHPIIGGTALSLPNIAYNDTANPYGPTIKGCRTREAALKRLREAEKQHPEGQTLLAWGWDSIAMEDHLSRKDLDKVSTSRPLVVWDCSMHFVYTNTTAIRDLNLKPSIAKSVPGVVLEDSGELAGTFLGVEAVFLVKRYFLELGHVDRGIKSILHIANLAKQGGITTMAELMLGAFNIRLEEMLYDLVFNRPEVPLRLAVVVDAKSQIKKSFGSTSLAVKWLKGKQEETSEKLIYNNGVKFFMDDSFLGLTIKLAAPGYCDGIDHGVWNNPPGVETMNKMLPFWKAGCRIHVHSNGHQSQDALAKILSSLQTIHPRFDHRFCFEHYGMSSESLTRRLKNLGANASVNPFYHFHRAEINEPRIGVDIAHSASKLRTLVDCGVPCALHTDTPVAPPRPLEEIWIAVNRLSESGNCRSPHERVTPYQALRMKTVDAAYVLGLDDVVGSIEPGKFADFVVLHENPLTCDPTKIRDIRIWGTVQGGKPFRREDDIKLEVAPPGGFLTGLLWLFASTTKNPLLFSFMSVLCSYFKVTPDRSHQEMIKRHRAVSCVRNKTGYRNKILVLGGVGLVSSLMIKFLFESNN